jgi:hypothetical protein
MIEESLMLQVQMQCAVTFIVIAVAPIYQYCAERLLIRKPAEHDTAKSTRLLYRSVFPYIIHELPL